MSTKAVVRTDSASWSFYRQRIVELCACGSDTTSLSLLSEPAHRHVVRPRPWSPVRLQRPPRATASGRTAEDTMHDELAARQRAISLRLAGRAVKHICSTLGRI